MMKHKGSSYCCRWFTLFLLAMGIVLVSPDIHTDFADNYKQMKSKGATATTITTTMSTNALRTIKMLEAMGIIDANRYNVNDRNNNQFNNNNNLHNYNSNMLIVNSNSKNNNKMHINSASSYQKKMRSQQLEPLAADRVPTTVEEELEAPELALEQELAEHMVSTPHSMTIMVEKPTMVKHTTTTQAAIATATTTAAAPTIMKATTTTPSTSNMATTLATASKPSKPSKPTTTTTITIATSAITTHSGSSTIKLPLQPSPDNVANINVNGINAKSTMMYKQQQQHEQQQQLEQHWQLRQHERQQHYPLQQQQHAEVQVVVAYSRNEQKPQKYIGNTLLGDSDGEDSGSTQATASMVVDMPERRGDDKLESVTTTTQTQIAINGNNNSNNNINKNNNMNSNRIVDGITTPITATTTTTLADTITITPTTQSNQFESVRILYDYKANDATDDDEDDLKPTKETDVQMVVVAQNEEMEVDRQYKQKFSSSYSEVNSGNTHNYAAVAQLSAHQQQHQHQQQQWQRQQQQRSRWVRQAEEEPIDKCRQFNEGDAAKNEFYSPDYPNYYPKNINCTRVITAPLGQIIRLDFRNSFHIEAKEDCKFDVLEIRDGQYGFSNLLGKFCGTDFPPEITSRERYLWLHFHSDESIEYSGFTAVYEFVDRRKEAPTTDLNCTIEKHGYEGFANSSDVPEDIRATAIKNRVPLDCIWRIQVEDNWKILMKFIEFRLIKPNDCDANFLDIFPEETVMPLRLKNFCGSAGEGMTIEANVIHIRFYAEPPAIPSSFSIMYTAYRDRGAACTDEEFDCEDATCISKELECNARDNCKFRWDEEKCKKEEKEGSEHILIIMIVFGLILGGMITTFLVNCIRKIMHDQKIIREHIRQSKESKLNELGRNSKARSRENLSSTMTRPKHSQTSLQILNDTSNHYYREVVPMSRASSKSDLKDREHSILRHRNDIVVQTSFCVDDNSSEATVEAAMAANACDMGCQTRESLFATPLMHQNSMGSIKDKASLHSRSRFSTFGYEAAHQTPPPSSAQSASIGRGGQLTGLNIREAQEYIEMRERHPGPKPKMPHMHRMDALPPTPPTPAVLPPEMCHHHHQHAAAAHTHVHTQQQQHQQHHQQSRQQSAQQQQQLSMQPSKENAGSGRSNAPATTTITTATSAQGKAKPKLSQSTAYIDIRNSAPDVIIMTSH